MKKFSKNEAIRFGWDTMKDNLVFYIVILLLSWLISGAFSALGQIDVSGFHPYAPFGIVSWVIGLFFSMAFIRISLKLVDGQKPEFTDLWASYRLFWKFLGGYILYFLIVLGGLILLIVPGIIWAIKYSLFGFLIIDREMGPVEAIKASGRLTQDAKGDLFLLALLFIGITILGALACVVGLFAAIPTVMIAHAYVYRKLAAWTPAPELATAPGTNP